MKFLRFWDLLHWARKMKRLGYSKPDRWLFFLGMTSANDIIKERNGIK